LQYLVTDYPTCAGSQTLPQDLRSADFYHGLLVLLR
jgi:hypothetical protein